VNYLLHIGQAAALVFFYFLSTFIYYNFIHPLRAYPGPKLWAFSRIPYTYHKLAGHLPYSLKELHDKYGEVVRVGPHQLSYNASGAWEDIYGFVGKNGKEQNFPKDLKERISPPHPSVRSIINVGGEDHRRMRKLQAHAFSDKALTAQEPILQDYVRQFVAGLKTEAKVAQGGVPLGKWYNFTTFDLIGDLAFGENFGCVDTGELNSWIQTIFDIFEVGSWITESKHYPIIGKLVYFMIPKALVEKFPTHKKMAADKATRRMDKDTDRPDFMSYIMKNNDTEKGMSRAEIRENASLLIIAGSETTASTLTGVTHYLLKNRPVLDKLTAEIRAEFETQDDMTLHRLAQMKYLNAVIEEGMRLFPAVPSTLPRMVPEGGAMVLGRFVPAGTTLGVNQMSANKSSSNFTSPDSYIPERWLSSPPYPTDDLKARQPFHVGPANCIGKNLAYAEMRLLLANVCWHFDLEMV